MSFGQDYATQASQRFPKTSDEIYWELVPRVLTWMNFNVGMDAVVEVQERIRNSFHTLLGVYLFMPGLKILHLCKRVPFGISGINGLYPHAIKYIERYGLPQPTILQAHVATNT